jgi:hypothetical protein
VQVGRKEALAWAIFAAASVFAALTGPSSAFGGVFLKGTAETHFTAADASVRAFWHDQGVAAGSNIVRINVFWRGHTTGEPADGADPADPAYSLGSVDRGVIDAVARGQRVLLTIYGTPEFAVGPNESSEAPKGTWKPDRKKLADFTQALATRYSGTFSVPGLGTLPRVGYIEIWNEANLSQYLTPQYTRKSTFAGDYYKEMVNASAKGISRSANPTVQVVAGATAPYGDPTGGTRTRPLRFMRDFLCLDDDLKRRPKCGDEADFDILSHHPITLSGGPNRSAIHPDDVAMPDVKNLVKALRRAEKRNTVTGGRHPVWATEFWWETSPPDGFQGVSLSKHANWIQESLHSLWRQGADAAFWFLLVDQPLGPDGISNQQSGLFFEDRSRKPAFTAFRFPFVGERSSKGSKSATVWTIPPVDGTLEIQVQDGGGFETAKTVQVSAFEPERVKMRLPAKAKIRGLLAGETSLTYTVK